MAGIDFNNEENRSTHLTLVAIFLANLSDDLEIVNTARAYQHIDNHIIGGKPSDAAIKEAEVDFYVMWEHMKNYRKWYADDPDAETVTKN